MDAKVNAHYEMREVPASGPTHEGLNFREVAVLARRFVRRQFYVIMLCVSCSLLLGGCLSSFDTIAVHSDCQAADGHK